jgi:hypothetical protein
LIIFITLERSETRQDKFESILEIKEYVVKIQVESAQTETENWDLLVVCRDGRNMLDAGVHISAHC